MLTFSQPKTWAAAGSVERKLHGTGGVSLELVGGLQLEVVPGVFKEVGDERKERKRHSIQRGN